MDRESVAFHGPSCRCGSRETRRIGYMLRQCCQCGETYAYRVSNGHVVPMAPLTAMILDEERKGA